MGETAVKVVLLGNSAVGKTTLVTRWTEDRYDGSSQPTIGAAYKSVTLEFDDGKTYSMNIWDTAGQDEYRSTTSIYCRDAKAAMIVFDLTDRSSFEALDSWISTLSEKVDVPFVIVGNKSDIGDRRAISFDDGAAFAERHQVSYFETSALTNFNVDEAFNELSNVAINFLNNGSSVQKEEPQEVAKSENQKVDLTKDQKKKKKSDCCK
ncbi:Ras family protein [Trichomonas vaginalis G3]|uniref:Ras family protein n=1 Tax=Trichomonas vaginalis (strain ATCC PRA-98 / G3) TaxID=412133 RepID=A2EEL9_TRIV3|nr:GTPase protein [Trichomonas vaginalis G3]EAY08926.1 Ras family protein [Trichomonas vaginalis G3]KAI5494392.1 GTPase protein [Trichomonas vaginalis G3]|eukprot:XP_001321149.1 Ras family protein [Trichomonas vaginalis G3]